MSIGSRFDRKRTIFFRMPGVYLIFWPLYKVKLGASWNESKKKICLCVCLCRTFITFSSNTLSLTLQEEKREIHNQENVYADT